MWHFFELFGQARARFPLDTIQLLHSTGQFTRQIQARSASLYSEKERFSDEELCIDAMETTEPAVWGIEIQCPPAFTIAMRSTSSRKALITDLEPG
jgi:hypothetical protein